MSSSFPFTFSSSSSLLESSEVREVVEGDCRGVSSGDAAIEFAVEEEVEFISFARWAKLLRAVTVDMVVKSEIFHKKSWVLKCNFENKWLV